MRLITYTRGTDIRPGLAMSDQIGLDLLAANPSLPPNWHALFAALDEVRNQWERHRDQAVQLEAALAGGNPLPLPFFALRDAVLLAPILLPSKIIAVGLNYRDHAREQGKQPPERPMLFAKAPSCLQADGRPIEIPAGLEQVDAEAELAVVISRPGRAIPRERAAEHIAGYTCFNDVSDREAQYADKQFFRGKSLDTGGPCGPWIVTPDELPDLAHGLRITCRWNDTVMQDSNTDQLIFPVDEIIAHASGHMTLMPGDIIATGTPAGVGVFRRPQVFLRPGDVVEVAIEGIGTLTNPVVRWEPSH